MSCPPAGGGISKFPLPTIQHFIKGPSLGVRIVFHLPDLWCILGVLPTSLFPEVACLHSFCWPSGLQSFSLTQYQIRFLSNPTVSHPNPHLHSLPSSSLPPFLLVIAFFSLPSGTEASSLGHFSLLSLLNSVDCILCTLNGFFSFFNIHLLVTTYYACPFGP